jgi:hypothetical protein
MTRILDGVEKYHRETPKARKDLDRERLGWVVRRCHHPRCQTGWALAPGRHICTDCATRIDEIAEQIRERAA